MDNTGEPQIEVTVTMYNINYGHNKEILEACKPLMEYSWFVEEIRKIKKNGNEIGIAVDLVLDSMSEDFVIRQFLLENRAEVKDVFLTEYNEQKTMAAFRDEGYKEGRVEGRAEGREEGRAEGRAEGKLETLLGLVKDGILTLTDATKRVNMTEEEFTAKITELDV